MTSPRVYSLYPCLWEVKNRPRNAVLNSLPEMPMSLEQLMQTLKNTRGETGAPFGRLPTQEQFKQLTAMPPDLFVRRLVCLELPHIRFARMTADFISQVVEPEPLMDSKAALKVFAAAMKEGR